MTKLVIMGGGRMGEALIGGLISTGWASPSEIAVVEPLEGRRKQLEQLFPQLTVVAGDPPPGDALIAVKPNDVESACRTLSAVGCSRVLSIAAGVPTATIEGWLNQSTRVVRAMPNTPALVGAGAAAISAGSAATEDDLDWAASLLGAVGVVVRLPEKLLDAVTGLSGSGPAYVFLVAEALIEAGVMVGLPRDASQTLAIQTLVGAARLLAESGDSAETLRAAVTSPGGTTAAGLHVLESRAVRAAFADAVAAATERSRQLGAS